MNNLVQKWQSKFNLKEWSFPIQEILPTQVLYDNECPVKDRYFVGIEIDKENKTLALRVIYNDNNILKIQNENKVNCW